MTASDSFEGQGSECTKLSASIRHRGVQVAEEVEVSHLSVVAVLLLVAACTRTAVDDVTIEVQTVAATPTSGKAADGSYISWKEHLIDTESIGGVAIRGSDGLEIGDLDQDGHIDVVSVHEADTTYDGIAKGHVRVAFGAGDPTVWELATLADGEEAGAAEDVAIADANGDGFPDVVVACELAHLLYVQNPGTDVRTASWQRTIPAVTRARGSYIRVFFADFAADGRPEVVTANKGAQNPLITTEELHAISWFELPEDPLSGDDWVENELIRVRIPDQLAARRPRR